MMMTGYTESFKARMVARLLRPDAPTPYALSKDVNVSYQTLTRWLDGAKLEGMTSKKTTSKQRPTRSLSAAAKFELVKDADKLDEAELGTFLRRNGLHEAELTQWREAALAALDTRRRRKTKSPEARRIRELEHDLARKEKALAEHATLLALKKRPEFAQLWADEDSDTMPRCGR
ncbi:MAG: hypothetical protein KAI66_26540 [Lentisphaeria bacterium]|nr:hypothetical protein [Lentisphaeria bacterium]